MFIICTQLPRSSTIASSQLPAGCFDAPDAAIAGSPRVSFTCSVRSTFALALRRIAAKSLMSSREMSGSVGSSNTRGSFSSPVSWAARRSACAR